MSVVSVVGGERSRTIKSLSEVEGLAKSQEILKIVLYCSKKIATLIL